MDTDTFRQGRCQKTVGIGIPQVSFAEEGQLVQVVDSLDILGLYTLLIHEVPVVGDIFVNMLNLLDQLFGLKLFHILPGHGFDFFLIVIVCHFDHPFQLFCWGSEWEDGKKSPSAFR